VIKKSLTTFQKQIFSQKWYIAQLLFCFDELFSVICEKKCFQILPEDAHRRVSKALHISITDVYTGQNKVISSYATRAELIDVS